MTEDLTATKGPRREIRSNRETARGPASSTVSRDRFDAPIKEVWELLADPDRNRLWNPDVITGDFREGGKFSVRNNASGTVLRCEQTRYFRLTWEYGDNYSELEVRLGSAGDGATVVEIEHFMKAEDLTRAGMTLSQGLVAAGAGWDQSLDYLSRYLRGEVDEPPSTHGDWEPSDDDNKRYSEYEKAWQQVAEETLKD